MKIEIWSDVVCPWCYIGKRRLETALEAFEPEVEITWRSFELDTTAPLSTDRPLNELLARKYRMPIERADAMMENVRQMAHGEGLEFNWDTAKTGNTFDAHRLIHYAKSLGQGPQMKERLLQAYFTDGVAISDRDALVEVAADFGLDAQAVRAVLDSTEFAEEVRADEGTARQIGVTGVPFFLLDDRFAIPGAQSAETMLLTLQQVQAKIDAELAEGQSCDIDGC